MKIKGTLIQAVIAAAWWVAMPAWADALLDRARALIDVGRGGEAYPLLAPHEAQRKGEPEFDLLYGVAAFEAGENTRALFALERVLAVDPGNNRARAEIARVYLAIGDTEVARREFENVKRQGVPPEVASTIEKFLEAVSRIEDETRPSLKAYVEGTLGADSNVNSSMGNSSQAIPALGGFVFQFGPGATKTADSFASLGAGLRYRNPLGDGLAFIAGLSAAQRSNFEDHEYDTANLDGHVGLVKSVGDNIYTVTLQANGISIDHDRYRNATGLTGQWQHNLSTREQVTAYLQYSDLRYKSFQNVDQSIRDAHRWVFGAAYARAFEGGWIGYAGAYLGAENEKARNVPHLGHDLAGVRLGGERPVSDNVTLFANLAYEHRRYGGEWPLFLTKREDNQTTLGFGANIVPAKHWLLTPQVSLTHNDSSVSLTEFRRKTASITLRRDF
ncbi:MAG: DUF560 domain-containing protein [Verrucomicrobia subdivision 3 bacterium]|nr:DUF560 domain-containing protein [Limisphaerales bacterium]